MTDEQKEQAALFALGLLGEDESTTFCREAELDPELAALTREYQSTLGAFALGAGAIDPPADLRGRILEQAGTPAVDDESYTSPGVPINDIIFPIIAKEHGIRATRVLPWAIAASFAIFSGILLMRLSTLQKSNEELVAAADWSDLKLLALSPATPGESGASARVLWDPSRGSGVIEPDSLPTITAAQVYQLWVFEKDNPAPVAAGFFDPSKEKRATLRPERPVGEVVVIAVSLEVAGGRPQPEGPVVLVGKLEDAG